MRVKFERSGGFANIPLSADLDSAEMEPDRAAELKRLVEEARPFRPASHAESECS
jgi:hypothetical protein